MVKAIPKERGRKEKVLQILKSSYNNIGKLCLGHGDDKPYIS